MNNVNLIGRLTRDPDVRHTPDALCVARFTVAIDRPGKKDEADFPGVVAFGKTAEVVDKYAGKGDRIGVSGRLQTRSYDKDGRKVYTTEVVADRVDLLGEKREKKDDAPDGFDVLDDELPF